MCLGDILFVYLKKRKLWNFLPTLVKPSSKADGQNEQKQLCLKQWLNLSNQIENDHLTDLHGGSSAAELCDFPMKIKHFETQMVPAHWPAALELENQRQQVGIHGSFVRLQTRGLAMKRCETVMHMHPIREFSASFSHFSSRLETKRDHDRSKMKQVYVCDPTPIKLTDQPEKICFSISRNRPECSSTCINVQRATQFLSSVHLFTAPYGSNHWRHFGLHSKPPNEFQTLLSLQLPSPGCAVEFKSLQDLKVWERVRTLRANLNISELKVPYQVAGKMLPRSTSSQQFSTAARLSAAPLAGSEDSIPFVCACLVVTYGYFWLLMLP